MTGTGGYVKTALALFLVAVLLFLALSVPDVVNRWYDHHRLGQVEYVDMNYEPYELVYYHSLGEELGAISECLERGIELRQLTIEEGDDAPGDEELLAMVNEELEELRKRQLFYEGAAATEILRRSLSELYPVGNCRDIYPQNVFCWSLTLRLSDGSILMLDVDRDYHKIYSGVCMRESLWGEKNIRQWIDYLDVISRYEYVTQWSQYWELEGEVPQTLLVDAAWFIYGDMKCWSWGLEPKRTIYSFDTSEIQVW